MTSPIVIKEPGWGDAVQEGMAPLLKALEERKQRELQKEHLLIQRGQLAVDQEKLKDQQTQHSEQKKGFEDEAAALQQQLAGLEKPGPLEQEIRGAFESGDTQLMQAVVTKVQRAAGRERSAKVREDFSKVAALQKKPLDEDQLIQFYDSLLQADPEAQNVGSIATVLNTLRGRKNARSNVNPWQRGSPEKLSDGSFHNVWYNKDTGERRLGIGAVATPYTALIESQGTGKQQDFGKAGVQMRLAANGLLRIQDTTAAQGVEIADEIAPMLAKLETAGTLAIPFIGKAPEIALRQFGLQDLSPEAQEYMTHIFNWRAAKVFSDGGKQLTANEIMETVRGFMPYLNEDPSSKAAKRQQIEDQTMAVENLGGGATSMARKGTSLDPTKSVTPKAPAKRKYTPNP